MPYHFYLCGVEWPVLPAKFTQKIKSQNKTLGLLNGPINIPKTPGLQDFPLTVSLPMVGTRRTPDYYIDKLKAVMDKKKPTQMIMTRTAPDGSLLFDTNEKVTIEDFNIVENGSDLDVQVDISLREYVDYGTQTIDIKKISVGSTVQKVIKITKERETHNAPTAKTYTIKSGDTLWAIAKKYLGSGSKFTDIVKANSDKIKNPNNVPIGTVLTIPE